jgi:hypothetical protein
VFGLSSQDPDYQAEVVKRLDLPFTMLSDERLKLAEALNLPTFSASDNDRLYAPDSRAQGGEDRACLLRDLPAEHASPAGARLAGGKPR